jgi:hypothetical protein
MKSTIEGLRSKDKERIEAIAKELSQYGLGIFVPHAHDENGNIVPLPEGIVLHESGLKVRFIPQGNVPLDSVAVGWRWDNGALIACAHCCKFGPKHRESV